MTPDLDAAFTALADPTRRAVVQLLRGGPRRAGELAEALARGLPVVSTATGAIADLVGPDAGLLVPPGDAAALTTALSAVVTDPALRARLAAGAQRARARLRSWDDAASVMARTIEHVDG